MQKRRNYEFEEMTRISKTRYSITNQNEETVMGKICMAKIDSKVKTTTKEYLTSKRPLRRLCDARNLWFLNN